MRPHIFSSLMVTMLAMSASVSAQNLYAEDFEAESPQDATDLCLPEGVGYVPADGNWTLGPACGISQNGTSSLADVSGDTYIRFHYQFPDGSEVWNAQFTMPSDGDIVLSGNVRSEGGHENSGAYSDSISIDYQVNGVSGGTLFSAVGHVDGFGNGSNTTRDAAYSVPLHGLSAGDVIDLSVVVRISGADGSESYLLDDVEACLDTDGNGVCNACDLEVTFDVGIDDFSVQCVTDLPDSCLAGVVPSRGMITGCSTNQERLAVTTCTATTAVGDGDDGAIVLMDVNGDPLDDRFFVPAGEGLRLLQYGDGTARVEGQVADVNDPNALLNVFINYANGVSGADWNGGYKSVAAPLPTATTDEWTIYTMEEGTSLLVGDNAGNLAGTVLQLSHAPSSEYFGFQVGEAANDRNLNLGAGGWFSYSGTMNGLPIQGAQGDVLVDLDCNTGSSRNGCPTADQVTNNEGQQVTLRYTWVDLACGQANEFVQVVTALDTTKPVLAGLPADSVLVYCVESLPDTADVTATDNCELDTLMFTEVVGLNAQCTGTYQILRQWVATDCTGNIADFVQTIYVVDTVAPVITAGADTIVECDGSGNVAELNAWLNGHAGATAADGCGTATWQPPVETGVTGGCGHTSTTTYTFSVQDDCGNTASVSYTFTIEDTTAPALTSASDTTAECDGSGNTAQLEAWLAGHGGATATEACGEVTWTHNHSALSDGCGETGSTTVTFYATDACNNVDSVSATFTIVDTLAPVLTAAADTTTECDGSGNTAQLNAWLAGHGGATATDACSAVTWSDDFVALGEGCAATGTVSVWFVATDACGNADSTQASFTIEDTLAPTISMMASDTTAECDGAGNGDQLMAWLNNHGGASATDACSGPVGDAAWSYHPNPAELSNACAETGGVTVWFVATDACGNADSTQATFEVVDTTLPVPTLTAPHDTTLYAGTTCYVDTTTLAIGEAVGSATDNCDAAPVSTITYSDASSGSCDGGYTFTRTWKIVSVDACGLTDSTTALQNVTVLDTLAPTWNSYIPYEFVSCELMEDPTDPTKTPITATDNCSGVRYEIEAYMMSGGCPGTWMRVWTAIDSCGNRSEPAEQYIQLFDDIAPSIALTCPADYTVEVDADCMAAVDTSVAGTPTVVCTDNCTDAPPHELSYSDGAPTSTCAGSYSFIRTWTVVAEDYCERRDTAMCDQTITVLDSIAPLFDVLPMDTVVECNGAGNAEDFAAWVANQAGGAASDNCNGDVSWSSDAYDLIGECGSTGADTVTFTITDACGNTSMASAIFTIVDTTPPSILALTPFVIDCYNWDCNIDTLMNLGAVSAEDACGEVTLVASCTVFSAGCLSPGAFEIEYTATDACGLQTTAYQLVHLRDTVAPEILTHASDTLTECHAGNADELSDWLANHGGATAQDDCGNVTWSNDFTALNDSCGATGAVTVTFTVTDDCANLSHTTATFQIVDTTAPVLTANAQNDTVECDGAGNTAELQAWLDSRGGAVASDDCSGPVSWSNDHAGLSDDCGAAGSTTVTFTATDSCGNASFSTATFVVEDTMAPVISVAAADTATACDGSGNTAQLNAWLANHGGASATDACSGVTWTHTDATLSDDCGATGAATVTFYATDDCGLMDSTTATFTIEDLLAPEFTTEAMNDTVECDGAGNTAQLQAWLDNHGGAVAAEACSEVTWFHNYECDTEPGEFNTYRQSALGAGHSTPASDYLDANFASVFPNGVTAGCGAGHELVFTSAAAVDTYLPCTGGAEDLVLTHGGTNPTQDAQDPTCWNNAFVSHLLTAKLNVGFDAADGNYSNDSFRLADLVYNTGALSGYTVADIIAISDEVLGGCSSAFTPSQLRSALRNFNKNFEDGLDRGFLQYPGCDNGVSLSDGCGGTGEVTVTFLAMDDCGNESETAAMFVIEDTTPPTLSAMAADSTVECDGAGNVAAFNDWLNSQGGAEATDVCSGVSWTHDYVASPDSCGATTEVTVVFTASDSCNNETTTSATFKIVDTTAPAIGVVAVNDTAECDGAGNPTELQYWLDSHGGAAATDDCGTVSWDHDYVAGSLSDGCGATGEVLVTFTATDECGNASLTAATFVIEDTTAPDAPSITCPNDTTVYIDCVGDAPCNFETGTCAIETGVDVLGLATATSNDACDANPTLDEFYIDSAPVFTCMGDDGNTEGSYTFTRTFYAAATDACGLTGDTANCVQTITVKDQLPPVITVDSPMAIACDEYHADSLYAISAADACDSDVALSILTNMEVSGACPATYLRTYQAVDDCGNAITIQQIINVYDSVAPALTLDCPSDTTLYLDAACMVDTTTSSVGMATTVVTDNCDNQPSVTLTYVDAVTDQCGSTYDVVRTWTAMAKDTCNNETTLTCVQNISVRDNLDPVLACPADTAVQCDGAGNEADIQAFLASVSATDNCDADVTITHNYTAIDTACALTGAATVTFIAEDDCGNTDTCTVTISIIDTVAPSIDMAAADSVVQCDGAGNAADVAAWLANLGGASASESCSGVSWSHNYTGLSDGCGETGMAEVTFYATDSCANVDSTTAVFMVVDTIAPTILNVAVDTLAECDGTGNLDQIQAWLDGHAGAAATDACSAVTWSNDYVAADHDLTACSLSIDVRFYATDACANVDSTTATFTIEDTTDPEFDPVCPSSNVMSVDASCAADTSVATNGTATFENEEDNCDAALDMAISHADSTAYPCPGSMVVYRKWTITATDDCANSTTKECTQVLTVNDDTAPSITCPNDTTVECDGAGNVAAIAAWLDGASAADNCSVAVVTHNYSGLSDGCGATGSATVWFYATDACNNVDSCSATFTVVDSGKPSLTLAGETELTVYQNMDCNVDTSFAGLAGLTATASDVCSGSASVDVAYVDGPAVSPCDCGDLGTDVPGAPCDAEKEGSYTFERAFTVTATDACGNDSVATWTQSITVLDTIAPQFTDVCNLDNGLIQDVCSDNPDGDLTLPEPCEPIALDNCDSEVDIAFTEVYTGTYAPNGDIVSYCLSSVPEAFEGGETCSGHNPHNLRLFGIGGMAEFYAAEDAGLVQNMADGTWVLNQTVMALDGSGGGWILDVTYGAAMDWDAWLDYESPSGNTNTSYKLDCGTDLVDNHEDWEYRIMESGTLTGIGAYSGSQLSLSHSPQNHFYAGQFGESGNNQNTNYGYSAWLRFSGVFMGSPVMGSGDIFGDLDCTLPWGIERTWVASDDCSNSVAFSQAISINGALCPEPGEGPTVTSGPGGDHTPVVIGGAGDLTSNKTPIRVTNLQPNPTNDWSLLGFQVTQNMRLRVDMYTMDGLMVAQLYDGIAAPNVNHTLDIHADELESGMYQIRLSSSQYLVVKKLLVTE